MKAPVLGFGSSSLLGLLACGSGTGDQAALANLRSVTGSLASVEFRASTTIAVNAPPPVHVTTGDAAATQSLFTATLALPAPPSGSLLCPNDYGVTYQLVFRDAAGSLVASADLDPAGCRFVSVTHSGGSSVVLWTEPTDESYWSILATSLGIAEAEIYPWSNGAPQDAGTE